MMNKINNLIDELSQSRPKTYLDIIDVETGKHLYRKIDKEFILSQNNDITSWFKGLGVQHDVNKIQVHRLRANGSSYKRNPVVIDMIYNRDKSQTNLFKQENNQAQKTEIMQKPQVENGLFGTGLTGYDLLNLKTKEVDYNRLQESYVNLQEENKRLKSLNDNIILDLRTAKADLSIAESKQEIAVEREKSNQKSVLESPIIAQLAQSIPSIISAIQSGGVKAAPGLAGSQNAASKNIPEWKQQFIDVVINDNVDQELLTTIYFVINELLGENKAFIEEFKMLLQLHNVIKQ